MSEQRCGFVALIGAPNAGKSTLINALVGSKIAIVSRKVQTTRNLTRGIVMHRQSQIIFTDTPGLFAPKRNLDRAMLKAAWEAANEADVVALLIDAVRGLDEQNESILQTLQQTKRTKILILNKVDLVKKEALLKLATKLNALLAFDQTLMISALQSDGIETIRDVLAAQMPQGPWLFDPEDLSDVSMRDLAAELTREKILERLHDEIPYESTVETEKWEELKDGSVRIEQTIYVTRDAHKKIVLGEGGQMIKYLSQTTRTELQEMLGRKVHLFLFVKVRKDWLNDPERLKAMRLSLK